GNVGGSSLSGVRAATGDVGGRGGSRGREERDVRRTRESGGGLSVLGHATPRSFDAIAAFGEQLSSHLVAAFFKLRGIPAEHLDARDIFVTDDSFMSAEPQIDSIAEAARDLVQPLIEEGKVPVLGGFIGRTAQGVTTTLGRGG